MITANAKTGVLSGVALVAVLMFGFFTSASNVAAAWTCAPDYLQSNPFANCVATEPAGVIGTDGELGAVVNTASVSAASVAPGDVFSDLSGQEKRELLFKFERLINLFF